MSSYIQQKLASGAKLDIFVTGATGFIGSGFTKKAVAAGHRVTGLSRNEAGDAKLRALGATPVRGDLSTLDVLRASAAAADAVVHLAWVHDFTADPEAVAATDMAATDAMMAAIAGTGKPLIETSGVGTYEQRADGVPVTEDAPQRKDFPAALLRNRAEAHVLEREDVHGVSIRLAPYCFGHGGKGFLYIFMNLALKNGESLYVGDGTSQMSSLHVDDAATVYLAAIQYAQRGQIYNAVGACDTTLKQMAEAIGQAMGVGVRSVEFPEAAEKWGQFLAFFNSRQIRVSSKKAQEQLHWEPKGPEFLDDIVNGSYREVAAEMKAAAKTDVAAEYGLTN